MSATADHPVTEAMLDQWLPAPTIRTRHSRTAPVSAATLWEAAGALRLDQTPALGRLVPWRIPGASTHQTFRELLSHDPFAVLEEGPHHSLSGLCGRIWTLSRDYPHLDGPQAFRDWDRPGTARVLFAHWTEPDGEGVARIVSEARVEPVDRLARVPLRSLWLVVRVFERLIGAEALEGAVRHAVGPAGQSAAR